MSRSRRSKLTLTALALATAVALGACGDQLSGTSSAQTPARPAHGPHFRFFSPHSAWNTPSERGAALDPRSAAIVAALSEEAAGEVAGGSGPWINTTSYSVPVYRVPGDQPTVAVRLESGYAAPALRRALRAVPLPPRARPSPGNDAHLVVWQPGSDRLWEFWHLEHGVGGWRTGWGGAIEDASASSGVYSPAAWPGASHVLGCLGLLALDRRRPDHARRPPSRLDQPRPDDVPAGDPRRRLCAARPPHRRHLHRSPHSLPEGAHLRLPPGLDLATLQLPHLTLMLARGGTALRHLHPRHRRQHRLQRPGTAARRPATPTPARPATSKAATPRLLLASFPWADLQLLKMRLRPFDPGPEPSMLTSGGT